jgi:hypothetical protein
VGKSKNPNNYSDVAAVLDAAIAAGGEVTYKCKHYAEAYRWRARAYHLRKLLAELAMHNTPPGMAPTTRYDHLFLTMDEKLPKEQRTEVKITFRKPSGTLVDRNGKVIEIARVQDVVRDPMQDQVEDLLGGLG